MAMAAKTPTKQLRTLEGRDVRAYLNVCLDVAGIARAHSIACEYLNTGRLDTLRTEGQIETLAQEIANEHKILG